MINFRFHLVSLIAVFLALALGIVVGSTVIDRAIVDGLEAQIDRVERNAEAQRDENAALRDRLDETLAFVDQVGPFVVEGRLADVPVVVLAARGADEEATRALVDAVRRAGAAVPAVLWLEPSWAVGEVAQRQALRTLVGLSRADAETARAVALEQLASRVAAGEFVPADPTAVDFLGALVEQGFVQVDPVGGPEPDMATFPGLGARVMVVSSAGSEAGAAVVPALLDSLADAALPTLAVGFSEPSDGDGAASNEPDGDMVRAARADDGLADRVSTVDSATGVTGRIAVVLALDELGRGEHGHYGSGPGAQRRLPEPAEA